MKETLSSPSCVTTATEVQAKTIKKKKKKTKKITNQEIR